MKLLHITIRILAVAVALWAVLVAVYLLFYAKVSYQGVSLSATQGEPPISTQYSGQQSWVSYAEPISIAIMLAFSAALVAGAIAAWRGNLLLLAGLSIFMLLASFISGFSIGGFYFPGAAGLSLCTVLVAIEKLSGPRLDATA
jgi:hypothetical protein